jgi:DNA polymerase III delta prime subunit
MVRSKTLNIIDWIKANAKEGANIQEAETLVKDLDPLKNITDQSGALDFINRNPVFKSALDSETSRRVENHDKNFMEIKFPGLIKQEREKIQKELNPDMTDEQKRIAELEKTIQQQNEKTKINEAKSFLRMKAAEIGKEKGVELPVDLAESFYIYGDQAENQLINTIDFASNYGKSLVEQKLKDTYGNGKPPARTTTNPEKTITRAALDAMPLNERAGFFENGGQVIDS